MLAAAEMSPLVLCPIASGGMRRRGYIRIEHEAGGSEQRIYPNDIRDNRRCDGREGGGIVRAKRDKNYPHVEGGSETPNRLCGEP